MSRTPSKKRVTCKVCGAEFYPNEKWQIDKEKLKLLLAEGVDVHRFLIYACEVYQKSDVQVINFGGINELRLFLKNLSNMENFSKVKTLVVACDAEINVTSTIDRVKSALNQKDIELPVPTEPFQFQQGDSSKTAFMLFPGPDESNQCQNGTIEDLCLATVSDDPLLNCVNTFLKCAEQNQKDGDILKHPWKSKLYSYLAGKDDHAGKRLSQAARDKVWDWDHDAMLPFRKVVMEM